MEVPLADGTSTYTDSVTVVSDRFKRPEPGVASEQTLTSADLLDLRGVIADNPLRAVQALPGVATGDDFRSELSVRGFDFRHMNVSVDGVTTRWLVHAVEGRTDTGSVSVLNGDVLDRVTLDAGAYPQERPGRTGASLSFDIREGSRDANTFHLAVSGSSASFVGDGPLGHTKRGSWLFSIRQSYLQWLLRKIDPTTNDGFAFTDSQAKFVFDLTPRHQVQVTLVGGQSRLAEREGILDRWHRRGCRPAGLGVVTLNPGRCGGADAEVRAHRRPVQQPGPLLQSLGQGTETELAYVAGAAWAIRGPLVAKAHLYLQRQRQHVELHDYTFANMGGNVVTQVNTIIVGGETGVRSGDASLGWRLPSGGTVDGGAQLSRLSLTGQTVTSPWLLISAPVGARLPSEGARTLLINSRSRSVDGHIW